MKKSITSCIKISMTSSTRAIRTENRALSSEDSALIAA
jgi:hypothetical protein